MRFYTVPRGNDFAGAQWIDPETVSFPRVPVLADARGLSPVEYPTYPKIENENHALSFVRAKIDSIRARWVRRLERPGVYSQEEI